MRISERAGEALLKRHEGDRVVAAALMRGVRSVTKTLGFGAEAHDMLAGASFIQQEPDLAKEAGVDAGRFVL